jgi:hypothetical protein
MKSSDKWQLDKDRRQLEDLASVFISVCREQEQAEKLLSAVN